MSYHHNHYCVVVVYPERIRKVGGEYVVKVQEKFKRLFSFIFLLMFLNLLLYVKATPAKLPSGNFTHVPSVENCTLVDYVRSWRNFSSFSVLAPMGRVREGCHETLYFASLIVTPPKGKGGNQIQTGPLHHTMPDMMLKLAPPADASPSHRQIASPWRSLPHQSLEYIHHLPSPAVTRSQLESHRHQSILSCAYHTTPGQMKTPLITGKWRWRQISQWTLNQPSVDLLIDLHATPDQGLTITISLDTAMPPEYLMSSH